RPPAASAVNAHVNPLVCRRYETFRIAGVYREPRVFGRKRADITPARPPVAASQSPTVVYFVEGSLCMCGGDITELGRALESHPRLAPILRANERTAVHDENVAGPPGRDNEETARHV